MGAFFTAPSLVAFIAGAGIVVRNSIILVDFIQLRVAQGMPLVVAVVDAGAVRFRPMMLTAAAVMVGTSVLLFDPIFQGLAISLMAGEAASLVLSRMAVPILYYMSADESRTDERFGRRAMAWRPGWPTYKPDFSAIFASAFGAVSRCKLCVFSFSVLCRFRSLRRLCPLCSQLLG